MRILSLLLIVVGAGCADIDPCATQQFCSAGPPPSAPDLVAEGEGEGEEQPPPPVDDDEEIAPPGGCPPGQSERELFRDSDGDGFTALPVVMCAGATPPVGFSSTRRLAPVLISGPSDATANDWNDTEDAVAPDEQSASITLDDNGTPSEALVVSGLACPSDVESGTARVHVRVAADNDVVATMNVVFGAASSSTSVALTDVYTDVVVELAVAACSESVSLAFVSDGSFNDDVYVDAVRVEVPGGNDCDDADAARASGTPALVDADGDGALAEGFSCVTDPFAPTTTPSGVASDCNDENAQCVEDCSAANCA